MGISTSTGTLTAGSSKTFNLSPASAVTLTLSPNVRVTITETPATVAATGLGGNASRVHEPRLPGTFTYGPYPMGGTVVVENESNSGSSVAWVRSDSIIAESADGSQSLVDGGGNPYPIRPSSAEVAQLSTANLEHTTPLGTAITLPNPYPSQANAPVHPSVLHFPNGWQGASYWMAYTPYPSANSDYENPTVASSNDGLNWTAKGRQPLVDKPELGYNADTHLFMSADGATMYLAFRERINLGPAPGQLNNLKVMQTTDGVNWSAPVTVLSGIKDTQDFGSPSIWWNGTGWTCISHNIDAVSPWPVQRSVSSTADIYGAWGAPSTVTIAPLAGRAWWHSFHIRLSSGQIVALFQDNAGSLGQAGELYWCESADDGVTYTVGQAAIKNFPQIAGYRSTFCVYQRGVDALAEAFIGDISGVLTRYLLRKGANDTKRDFFAGQAALLAPSKAPNAAWGDTFTRADGTGSLGTADSGGTYTASTGVWGISTNRAYPVSSGRALAAVGSADHEVSVRFTDITNAIQQWLICRAVDGANYWRIGSSAPTASGQQVLAVQSIVAGAVVINVGVARYSRGDTITARCSGNTLTVLVNGAVVYERLMTTALAGASIGMQANTGANTFMDNLTCVTL